MAWKLPFVSRTAFEERGERIAELKAEVSELDKERKRLIDFVSLGITQRSIYGVIPEPKDIEPEPEPEEKTPDTYVPSQLEQDVEDYGPNARAIQRAHERRNLAKARKDDEELQRLFHEIAQPPMPANGLNGR